MKSDRKVILTGIFAGINVAGSFIAATLRLPIYMDSMGTILTAILFGPWYAMACCIVSGLIQASTFDIYSLYFILSNMVMAFFAGFVAQRGWLKWQSIPFANMLIAIPASLVASMIAAYVFGGVTSSGSSYIVQILSALGMNKVTSVFITQVITDYTDKLIALIVMVKFAQRLPHSMKMQSYLPVGKGSIWKDTV